MPQRCIRSFVTSYRRRATNPSRENWLPYLSNCLRACRGFLRLFSLLSSCERTLTFLVCEHTSIVSRSVKRGEAHTTCEPCVRVLMFINCPRRQRNYFVNHPRGKMMARDAVSIVFSLLSLAQRPRRPGGGSRSPFFIFALLISRVTGSYPSNTINFYCFASPANHYRLCSFLFFFSRSSCASFIHSVQTTWKVDADATCLSMQVVIFYRNS